MIATALVEFATKPLHLAAMALFKTLGYGSERTFALPDTSPAAFLAEFAPGKTVNPGQSLHADWRSVQLLFQLTDDEIRAAGGQGLLLFDSRGAFDGTIIESYLFLAIDLRTPQQRAGDRKGRAYARSELAQITRAVNRLFSMPVLVLFKNGDTLTFAVINRRLHKRDAGQDVLEKVTLIKDIRYASPHRAHLEILYDLSLSELYRQHGFSSFPELHQAWQKTLDSSELNKRFFQELSNWYFWAREHAVFPPHPSNADVDGKPSLPLIRLLTRLMFCWFLREKQNPRTGTGLLPDELFDPREIARLLKDASPSSGTYYTAILQNLFFATLNTEMKTPEGTPNRRYLDEGDGRNSDDHMIHTVWRYADQLRDPEKLAAILRQVPFLNGGLFECLDDRVPRGKSAYTDEVRIDGFSNTPQKQPRIPNFLFFGADETTDLSAAYGDSRRDHETVRPLLSILRRYIFTLTENTPLDQDIALDPELLGHVFENLLAYFNPETGAVARKATGSFYTPRVVVDWMVDQALIQHLKGTLSAPNTEARLQRLLAWDDGGHDFTTAETETLITAIDQLKTLDPACGSGAFPMGMLQKLVHALKKLDPQNEGWRQRQTDAAARIESGPAREEANKAITRAFARDNDDYGRKLYLIENCLYGADIQPIAVQIAKLRFFISLIVDQAIDPALDNYGILPLPNLETKVVAANTLMGLPRGQLLLGADHVTRLEKQLQQVRHDYFTVRSYKRKKELRKEDRRLCDELAAALADSGECSTSDAKRLAAWNPYDTNGSASFFDPGWMFGLASPDHDGVFDIVIDNPPYVRQEELKNQLVVDSDGQPQALKDALKSRYACFTGTADLYVYFFERSIQLLRTGGVLSFITSNKYFRAAYGERLRVYLRWITRPSALLDFGDAPVFTAIAYPAIIVTQKTRQDHGLDLPTADHREAGILHPTRLPSADWHARVLRWEPGPSIEAFPDIFATQADTLPQHDLMPDGWRLEGDGNRKLLTKLRQAGTPLGEYVQGKFYRGILTGLNEAFVVDRATRDRLIAENANSAKLLKPFLRGRDVKRWHAEFAGQYLVKIESSENQKHPWSGKPEAEAERIFAKAYPAIHAFMQAEGRRAKLIARADQGKYYWELRSCAYWQEFDQPKVIFGRFMDHATYVYDDTGFYHNDALYFAAGATPYVAAILNSSINWWFLRQLCTDLQNGYLQALLQCQEQIPIPTATAKARSAITARVEKILALKQADDGAKLLAEQEAELDAQVAQLYGLDAAEFAVLLTGKGISEAHRLAALATFRDLAREKNHRGDIT